MRSAEIIVPAGQVTDIDVGGQNEGADLRLGRSPVRVGVYGQGNRVIVTSASNVALSVTRQSNAVSAAAEQFTDLEVNGQSNTVDATGTVARGSVDGMSNRVLIVGAVSDVGVSGMSNAVFLNGGDCGAVRRLPGGMSNSCAPSTSTVTARTMDCTAHTAVGTKSVCGGSAQGSGNGRAHTNRSRVSGGESGASLFLGMIPFIAASVYMTGYYI